MHDADVIIAGGGMVGLTLGIALAREGVRVILVERNAMEQQLDAAFDGRVSAIALSSQRLMQNISAWEGMAPHAQPILDIRVSDGASPFFLHYAHREVSDEPFGWIVENRYIRQELLAAAGQLAHLQIMAPEEIISMSADAAGVEMQGKSGRYRARLLVGADGKNSRMRALAGIGTLETHYAQTAIVCTIAHARPHHGLAQERFLPAGPFAVLPMISLRQGFGGQAVNRSSLVWTEPAGHAAHFLRMADTECVAEITERVGDYLGEIHLEGPRFSYPLSALHAKEYIAPRVALIGDAAHAIHPIAGQGVNLGFRDVAVLAELIAGHFRLGLDIGAADVLSRYQRWRRFDNVAMLAVTDGLNRLFSNDAAPAKLARGLGLWAVSRTPLLKRFFMRHAMGLTGDVPRLMREI